jgi:hypothetical protein
VFTTGASLAGTFSGTPTFSGAVALSGGGSMAGTFTGTPTFSGAATFTGGPTFSTASVLFTRATTTNPTVRTQVTADTQDRLLVEAQGRLQWGSGAAVQDTNLYRLAADSLATDDSFTVGTNLTVTGNFAGPSGVGAFKRARKLGDTNRSSTTTPSDDPELVIAMVANAVYELEGVLFVTSASLTPDFKMNINGPASSAGWWSSAAPSVGSTSDPDAVRTIASDIGTITTRSYGLPTVSDIYGFHIFGMVETAGTAGNLAIQWSQATSNGTATTMKIYSWIRLTRLT